jgi:hypothetical protein
MNPTDLAQKNTSKFKCIYCDFYTSNKHHFNRHLNTEKHKQRSILTNPNDLAQKSTIFFCECGKSYKHKPTLYAHKKKCDYNNSSLIVQNDEAVNYYKEIINELMNQNKNLMDQNKKFIELTEKSVNTANTISNTISNSNNNNNNNSNNKNVNINVFLNEKCKDAINIDEFVKRIEVSVKDLLFIKDKGIAKGLAKIITNNLNDLPLDKRPIWCSDKKRKKIFIKEEEWNEDIDNEKTKQTIKGVARMQSKNIFKYNQTYPNCMNNEKEKETFIEMVSKNTETTKGKEETIINNFIDTIYLDDKSKNELQ